MAAAISVSAAAGVANAQTSLKLGFATAATSPYGYAAGILAEEVKQKSGGRLNVEIFPASQLGGEREMIEGLQIGTLDLNFTSPAPLGNFVPDVAVFEVPFLIRGFAHADAVLDGAVGQGLIGKINGRNLVGLAFGYLGPVHLVTNPRPITKPEDLRGLKIRTQENEIHLITFRTLGALPTPMAFPELFGALQQGAVDGMDNPSTTVRSGRFFQAAKHISLTGHRFIITPMLASPVTWGKLSPQDRQIVADAAKTAALALRKRVQELEEETIKALASEGMQVTKVADIDAFVQALKPAEAEFARRFGRETLEAIRNTK
ncbi:MAG: TRAP transporter substrate-binding protein DctP [Alphaproteobacteria bacterium]|nr:TRAP transporter substrate-binding protein DctP [Alphaproteobacteria bacterium]